MKYPIDPTVDCVFKSLLGSESNINLLIHFLNAMLQGELKSPICSVEILNPYNEKEFEDDKLSIVDIKAQDQQQRLYQIEIQLVIKPYLPARMLYTWTDIYSKQLESGNNYTKLRPTYSLWILAKNLLTNDENSHYVHDYQLRNRHGQTLVAHGGIWLFELPKFVTQQVTTEQERWLKFFREATQLDETQLPDWMHTNEMRQAMETLKRFSDKQRDYFAYQARQNYLREQSSMQEYMEEIQREKETALQEKESAQQQAEAAQQRAEAAQQQAEAALLEIERLKALLENARADK